MKTSIILGLISFFTVNLIAQDTMQLNSVERAIRATMSKGDSDILSDASRYDSLASLGNDDLYKGKGKNFLGMSHHLLGDYEKAMTYYLQARDFFTKAGEDYFLALSLNNIGACMEYKRKPDLSIAYYKKALTLFEKENNTTWIANVNNNIGIQYIEMGDFQNAYIYHKKALDQHILNGDTMSTAIMIANMAELENKAGHCDKAKSFASQYLTAYKAYHQTDVISNIYSVLAGCHQKEGKFVLANQYNDKALEIREREGVSLHHLANNYLVRSEIQYELGNPTAAYSALNTYRTMQDSIFRAERDERITRLTSEFEAKYKNLELEAQNEKSMLLLQQANVQKKWYFLAAVASVLLFSLLYFFLRKRSQYKAKILSANAEIQKQQIVELEQKNQLLSLSAVIEGQESERMRIARDLHDGLGGLLTSVKAHFGAISNEIEQLKKLDVYSKTNQLIDEACTEVRRIAHNMIPHSLQMHGLEGALPDFKNSLEQQGISCQIDVYDGRLYEIGENNAALIYRTLQELLQNIIKHARATEVSIQFVGHENGLNITVEDNGRGFDINEVLNAKGMGLKSIESRVKYLGGSLHYDSKPGKGTQVNIELPTSVYTNLT